MNVSRMLGIVCLALVCGEAARADEPAEPKFSRHVSAIFSKAGCNAGTCHGAVQGKNGFRLSLFGAQPEFDYKQITRGEAGRRISPVDPEQSLLLQKALNRVPHAGGRAIEPNSAEHETLKRWLAAGAPLDDVAQSRIVRLTVSPREHAPAKGETYALKVTAEFADQSTEDVTALCSFTSLDQATATVDRAGNVTAVSVGDAAILVRFRDEPTVARALIANAAGAPLPDVKPHNFIDDHILAKLKRLNLAPAELTDDATFLRRARLDITGELPSPEEVQAFLADSATDKRAKKIEELLASPGYANLWALNFCDILGASDYGVYADGLAEHYEAPRFQAWVRARLVENTPYDEFAARIITATSRDGRSLEDWAKEVIALQEGYTTPRKDLELYAQRKTLDVYWQRRDSTGVKGAMQVAHAFLGLRLECAQCHRHPHDVWQQDDLLSFANFFVRVRRVGFEGDNEKKYPEAAAIFKQYEAEGKRLQEEAKKMKEGPVKELAEKAKKAEQDRNRLKNEIAKLEKDGPAGQVAAKQAELAAAEQTIAEHKTAQRAADEMDKRGKMLGDEIAKRVLHAQVFHRTDDAGQKMFASVESPLGSQNSKQYRLLGESENLEIPADEDPRQRVADWLRRPDNPFFAKAIVNRVWAHYFSRGLIDPPDDLSPYNAATHPELLDELCRQFIANKYDLKWLHRTIVASRTYQQSSQPAPGSATDRTNYAFFYLRRLPAEVVLDAVDTATGTREDLDMKYYHWPDGLKAVEVPYTPRNGYVAFMLEQFGRPERNSSVQCDCERQSETSMLQILSFANHPRIAQKIADPNGRAALVAKETADPQHRVTALYLATLSRPPSPEELTACLAHITAAENPEKGLQGVLWSLLNTREFVLQH